MQLYLFIFFFFILCLLIINSILKKLNISLDKEIKGEKHKSLLRSNASIPLSGTFYFLPISLVIFFNIDIMIVIFCSLFFLLGLAADLKIITSYKTRLILQFLFFTVLFFLIKDVTIDTRISFINDLMNKDLVRVLLCTFFFMVLINGFNLIDGTNCLCSLNFLIITIFIFLLSKKLNINYMDDEIIILGISIFIFVLLNFFGKNFLGDGATYGVGFILGYVLLNISLIDNNISPYFIANLLWFPAFENLFSIIRRNISKKNNYLPDNDHLHHLIFKFYKKNFFKKNNFLLSSIIGISINLILFLINFVGYSYYNNTNIQVMLILSGIILYLLSYYFLKKKLG